jgi:hypothetical protein
LHRDASSKSPFSIAIRRLHNALLRALLRVAQKKGPALLQALILYGAAPGVESLFKLLFLFGFI